MQPHPLTYPDTDSESYFHARYHYLLQIIFGETIAIDYCKTMAQFAPSEDAKRFLLKQQEEESTHLDMLTEYVGAHPRPHALISPSLKKMDDLMRDAIERRDYVDSVFIQNFIVEGLNISLLRELAHHTDGNLSELASRILKDEISHMDFGVSEIKRILEEDKSEALRARLISLQRKTLWHATGLAFTLIREARALGIPIDEFAEKTVSEHFERIKEAKLPLPLLDKILFNTARVFLKMA